MLSEGGKSEFRKISKGKFGRRNLQPGEKPEFGLFPTFR